MEIDFFRDEKESDEKIKQISSLVFKRSRILLKLQNALSVAVLYKVEFIQQKRHESNSATIRALVGKIRHTELVMKQIQKIQLDIEASGCILCPDRMLKFEKMAEQATLKDNSFE